jgi:hypothetical protein
LGGAGAGLAATGGGAISSSAATLIVCRSPLAAIVTCAVHGFLPGAVASME